MKDLDLLHKIAKAESTSFEYLYKEYYKMAEFFVLKNSGNKADAQDVFQDALVVFYEKTLDESFQLNCQIKTFIYSIVRNLWLKKLRDNKIKTSVNDFEKFVNITDEIDEEENESQLKNVELALQQLGEKCREIIIQFYYYKTKMEVIAQQLEYTNAQTAKAQKYKCMQQLKKLLNQ